MRWIAFKTLILRECGVTARFWITTLAPPVLTTLLYLVIFGEIIGNRIGEVDGVPYIRYIAPGLVLLWAIPYSFGHTAGGFLGARIFRYIEELLASPLPGWLIMLGYVAGGIARGLAVAASVALTVLFFTHPGIHSLSVSIVALLLSVLVSALAGFIVANLAKTFDHVASIQLWVFVPLTYASGAFAPLSELPGWARELSLANPMFYMTSAFRYGVLGISDVPVGPALMLLSAFAAVLLVAAFRMARAPAMRRWTEDS